MTCELMNKYIIKYKGCDDISCSKCPYHGKQTDYLLTVPYYECKITHPLRPYETPAFIINEKVYEYVSNEEKLKKMKEILK